MSRPAARGFTLIELMIVLVVMAILTAIAVPAYTQHLQRSHRNDARVALTRAAQWMERYRTEWGSYLNAANPPALPADLSSSPPAGSGKAQYTVSIASRDAIRYTLSATPVAGSMMAKDACGTLSLAQDGLRSRSGSASLEQCWTR